MLRPMLFVAALLLLALLAILVVLQLAQPGAPAEMFHEF